MVDIASSGIPGRAFHPDADLESRFTYRPPKGDQPSRYIELRLLAKQLAYAIKKFSPTSKEQSLALTKLEEAVMWVNAAIARGES